jgi:hypothetical protein
LLSVWNIMTWTPEPSVRSDSPVSVKSTKAPSPTSIDPRASGIAWSPRSLGKFAQVATPASRPVRVPVPSPYTRPSPAADGSMPCISVYRHSASHR